jgi:hypothetical protein
LTRGAPSGYKRPHDRRAAPGRRASGNGVGRIGLDTILQLALNGLAVGCIYGLVALGFVLIYKATELVNFAQGDLLMLGAFTSPSRWPWSPSSGRRWTPRCCAA